MIQTKTILVSTVLLFCPSLINSAKFPSFLTKCSRKQTDFDECVLKAGKNGLAQIDKVAKYLNLPPIDPFAVSELTIGAHGSVQLNQKYKNVEIYGFVNAQLKSLKFDFEAKTINFTALFPRLTFLADYEFSGSVLVLSVAGSGKCNITLDNLQTAALAKFEEIKKNNRTYIRLVSNELKIMPEQVYLNFENIFRGNEEISKNINRLINENWREVFPDVERGYTEVVNKIYLTLLNQFYSKVPYEEAFD